MFLMVCKYWLDDD